MQILDQWGRAFDEAALTKTQTGTMTFVPQTWGDTPVDGLTPAKLLRILKSARSGDVAQQSALYHDMEERDPFLLGEMTKRKNAVTSREMQIEPPDNPSANETKAADFFEEYIEQIGLHDHLYDACEAIGHGFSCIELEWGSVDGIRVPVNLTPKPPTWFRLRIQDGNIANAWRMNRTDLRLLDGSAYGAELAPFGWWVHVHRSMAGGLHRAGLFRVLAWLYLYKHFSLRDFAEFLEIYGIPPRVGKFDPDNVTQRDKAVLYQALQQLGHDAAGIIPNTMQIELLTAAGGQTDAFERMYHLCNDEYAKAISGKDPQKKAGLGGGNGQQEVGNAEVREDINIGDCRQLANSFTSDVLWPIAALNFGITELRRCPRLKFNIKQAVDLEVIGKGFQELQKAGFKIGKNFAYDRADIPVPGPDDEVLDAPAPPAPAFGSPGDRSSGSLSPGERVGVRAADPAAKPATQPKPADPSASLASLLSALAQGAIKPVAPLPERDTLDDLTDAMTDGWKPVMDDQLAPIRTMIAEAATNNEPLDALQARIHTALGNMDITSLVELIAKGQMLANLSGQAGLITPKPPSKTPRKSRR